MDGDELSRLRSSVVGYYSDRLRRYGATPLGVDWTCIASQELRFLQLLKLCDFGAPFSLNDVGCGYGALVGYLARRHAEARIDYLGIDLAAAMSRRAKRLWRAYPWAAFVTGDARVRTADYSVASGIFNVKPAQPRATWERFVALTLDGLQASSRRGFAVNFKLERPDDEAPEGLYRVRPEIWIRHCERAYGAAVTLLEGYGQPEFTLLVYRRNTASRT